MVWRDAATSSKYKGKYDLKLTTISYDRRFCMISNLLLSLMTGDSVISSKYRGKYDLKLTTISYDRRFCYEFQVQRQV